MTDPIADFLARVRNGILARKAKIEVPSSRVKHRLAEVLRDEGFLLAVEHREEDGRGVLTLTLRYAADHSSAIGGIRRVSRPGQRHYASCDKLPKVRSGLGVAIVTTSRGIMTDRQARKAGLGGEVLCEVW